MGKWIGMLAAQKSAQIVDERVGAVNVRTVIAHRYKGPSEPSLVFSYHGDLLDTWTISVQQERPNRVY
jgi:hypothetical protein